jgi:general secretion pathway protein G
MNTRDIIKRKIEGGACMNKKQNLLSGFTLIELLIVIAVISILIGIALPRFKGMQEEGNIAKAKGELRTLQTAVESYYIHNNNTYPSSLSALTSQTPNIVSSIPDDPFAASGTSYSYVRGGTNNRYYVIYSVGPGGNGSATISASDTVSETNGSSCIYVSNAGQDTQP